MPQEKLKGTLQENVITLLAHDDANGRIAANLVEPGLFEGEYRVVAERCIDYIKRHGRAPKHHVEDLLADILEDPNNRKARTFRQIIVSMLELSESINTVYVLGEVKTFVRLQRMKSAILTSAERLNAQQQTAIDEVEEIWNDLLRTQEVTFDAGMRLTDIDRLLEYLGQSHSEFEIGIEDLDKRHIVPYRGAVMLFLGATGVGKSWFLVHVGKHALHLRKKVLHISLEMSEDEVAQRYYQSLFAIQKRKAPVEITTLEVGKDRKLEHLNRDVVEPEISFSSPDIKVELESHITWFGKRYENLIIKRFPTRGLTISQLRAYLDSLETVERFIPDMLILDYIGIMNISERDYRISLGRTMEALRGLCVEKNIAGVTAQQASRQGARAVRTSKVHVAEDWSLPGTSDVTLTLSATQEEQQFGLARLSVDKARAEKDKFTVLITQAYDIGQFALESVPMLGNYFDVLGEMTKEEGKEDSDEEGDGDEEEDF